MSAADAFFGPPFGDIPVHAFFEIGCLAGLIRRVGDAASDAHIALALGTSVGHVFVG